MVASRTRGWVMAAVHRLPRKPKDIEEQVDELIWRAHMVLIRAAERAERRRQAECESLDEGNSGGSDSGEL
jgi:hypothetical protein